MNVLEEISTEAIEAELARRRALGGKPPVPIAQPDFEPLRKMIVEGVEEACRDGEWPEVRGMRDDDFKHYVYDAAVEAVYGTAFWAWRNKQVW